MKEFMHILQFNKMFNWRYTKSQKRYFVLMAILIVSIMLIGML